MKNTLDKNLTKVVKNKMIENNTANEALDLFVPRYSISLLYQKRNSVALRVFISDAKKEEDAITEATGLYNWTMSDYKLVQLVVANVKQSNIELIQ